MIRRYLQYAFIILFTAAELELHAQEKMSLTINEAIELGLKNSKMLHSSLMKVKGAEAKVKEANALRLPSFKLNAAYRRLSKVDPFIIATPFGEFPIAPGIFDNYVTTLTLAQPLFTGFRLAGNSELNEQLSNATTQEYDKDRQELIFNIKNSYWGLFKATQFKKVMDETVDQINARVNDAKNLEKVGMLTKNDILKIEVQLSNVLYQQIEAENSVKLATVALNNVLSIPLDTKIEIASAINLIAMELEPLEKLVGDAVSVRPEIKAAESRVRASEAGVTMAKASWYPQVSLTASYYYNRPNQRIMPTKDEFIGTWDAGVNLSINVWDWFTTAHQTDQAQAQLAQAVDGVGMIKDGITLEVTQNYLSAAQAKRKIEIADLTVKQAEENMKVTADKFKSGMATSSDVIDAETALISAKTNYTTSVVDYELSKARLHKSIGK